MSKQQESIQLSSNNNAVPPPKKDIGLGVILALTTILIVLMLFLAILFTLGNLVTCDPECMYIDVIIETDDENWSMTIYYVHDAYYLNNVMFTITDASGSIITPMDRIQLSILTEENWTTYGVIYDKIANETYMIQGARLIIDKTRYPRDCLWQFTNNISILGAGRFN